MRILAPANVLGNADFSAGSDNWFLQQGWIVGTANRPYGGLGNVGIFDPTQSTNGGTGAIVNVSRINVFEGGQVKAQCWATNEPGTNGQASIRIQFVGTDGKQIGSTIETFVPPGTLGNWVFLTVVGTAPLNASFALVDFAVYNETVFSWYCTYFFGAYLPGAILGTPVTYKQPLQYYLNLFTSQYRMSANLNQWQAALMKPIDDLTNCFQIMNLTYDIDNAMGSQLDVLGEILGQSRTLPFQPSGSVSPILGDSDYRLLLYATQAKNTWNGKMASLYSIWRFLFPNGSLVINDNQNMTATITASGDFTSLEQDLINKGFIVPRPEGVQYNPGGTGVGLFGFDRNDATVSGFDIGAFA